jgi:acetyl-CoA acetyltransferase
MKDSVAIVGVGETPPVRRSPKDIRTLVIEAILDALSDCGIAPQEVDGIVTEGVIMPNLVPHDYVAEQLGIFRYFDAATSGGAAGTVFGTQLAQMAIKSGMAKVVISYFGVDWGSNPRGPYGFHEIYPAKRVFERPYGFHGQPTYYALLAHRCIHEYGLTTDQLASLAIAQREHAILNGKAQTREPLTLEDYYRSPLVADPLRVPDCCLITDGAGAFVMTSAERARDCPHPAVHVMGAGYAAGAISADAVFTQSPEMLIIPGAAEASMRARKMAGISLQDIDFAEIYDCFTISCLLQIEDLGFCRKGEGGPFIEGGNTKLKGKIPINTHGGLLSYSYRLGIEHVIEAVRQLRGQAGAAQVDNAQTGLVGGYFPPEYGVLILCS